MQFREDGYTSTADAGFADRCVPKWQEECREAYKHDAELRKKLCETYLDRNYVLIRTLIPQNDILKRMARLNAWKNFDKAWFSANIPTYTHTGFQKIKLPESLHKAVQESYRQLRGGSRPETGQPAFGMDCNTGYDNDDWLVRPDERALAAVEHYIMQQLRDWTGQNVNERTSAYGVREYHRGSICGLHVDHVETHAFSAIYQVDQRGMDEPWASDYVTHQGEEGKIFLEPGEILLYESASSLHGRRTALKGDEFANVFFHFRSPEWLPAIKRIMGSVYWADRKKYENSHGPLLTHVEPFERKLNSADQCLEPRSRNTALLQEAHLTDPPSRKASTLN